LAAVQQNGRALECVSEELRIEIVQCWAASMEVKND